MRRRTTSSSRSMSKSGVGAWSACPTRSAAELRRRQRFADASASPASAPLVRRDHGEVSGAGLRQQLVDPGTIGQLRGKVLQVVVPPLPLLDEVVVVELGAAP